jgi:hypothetical protein
VSARSATSVLLFLRRSSHPDPEAAPTTYRLELDDHVWAVRTEAGRLHVRPGEPASPDASLSTDPKTLNILLETPGDLDTAMSDGSVVATGDLSALRRLLQRGTGPTSA